MCGISHWDSGRPFEPPGDARLSCKVAMLGWLQRYPWGDCVQDGVGVWELGGPWKFYAAVCHPKPLSGTPLHPLQGTSNCLQE